MSTHESMTPPTPSEAAGRGDWRSIYCRWQPYGSLVLVVGFGVWSPHLALFILALMHWTALDAVRTVKSATSDRPSWLHSLGHSLASQFRKVDQGHKFAGEEVTVTSELTYSGVGRSFVVRVERDRTVEEADQA